MGILLPPVSLNRILKGIQTTTFILFPSNKESLSKSEKFVKGFLENPRTPVLSTLVNFILPGGKGTLLGYSFRFELNLRVPQTLVLPLH